LVPNLGVVKRPTGDGLVVADIPGLIAGASEGVGLGHDFLRHVARTRLILHLVDIATPQDGDALANYHTIQQELVRYSPELAHKPQMLVLTKCDGVDTETVALAKELFAAELETPETPIFSISSATHEGINELIQAMIARVDSIPKAESPLIAQGEIDLAALPSDDSRFHVQLLEPGVFSVAGGKIRRWCRVTRWEESASVRRTMGVLKSLGVFTELANRGAQPGDEIWLPGVEEPFEFWPENFSHASEDLADLPDEWDDPAD
jgi:GTPase